jgi:hypothetical protein
MRGKLSQCRGRCARIRHNEWLLLHIEVRKCCCQSRQRWLAPGVLGKVGKEDDINVLRLEV